MVTVTGLTLILEPIASERAFSRKVRVGENDHSYYEPFFSPIWTCTSMDLTQLPRGRLETSICHKAVRKLFEVQKGR